MNVINQEENIFQHVGLHMSKNILQVPFYGVRLSMQRAHILGQNFAPRLILQLLDR